MKNLSLTSILVLISLISFSQIITLSFENTSLYVKSNKNDFQETKNELNLIYSQKDTIQTKIFDLNEMKLKYFLKDSLIVEIEICEFKLNQDGSYLFELVEYDIRDGKEMRTNQYVSKNESHYFWYWGFPNNESYLVSEDIIGFNIKK
jgi:hypothetical protein